MPKGRFIGAVPARGGKITWRWFGEEVITAILMELEDRKRRAGKIVVKEAKRLTQKNPMISNEGSPPYGKSGKLQRSIYSKFVAFGRNSVVRVAASAPHARFLEYGTRFMAARPFLRPAIANTREDLRKLFGEQMRNKFMRMGGFKGKVRAVAERR